ncbi:MAG: hypothetical protein ACHQYQ_02755 [Bacteriovoracales bacterium]
MKRFFLFIILFSILVPITNRAEEVDMADIAADISSPAAEEVAPPSDASPTGSSSEVAPEAMEEATFDDVSYE